MPYKNPEKQKKYLRNWLKKHPRYFSDWWKNHPLYYSEHKKMYQENARKYYLKNKEKVYARVYTNFAIKSGKLERKKCEECKRLGQAHHDDYSKPLKVRWLCQYHHTLFHKKNTVN